MENGRGMMEVGGRRPEVRSWRTQVEVRESKPKTEVSNGNQTERNKKKGVSPYYSAWRRWIEVRDADSLIR